MPCAIGGFFACAGGNAIFTKKRPLAPVNIVRTAPKLGAVLAWSFGYFPSCSAQASSALAFVYPLFRIRQLLEQANRAVRSQAPSTLLCDQGLSVVFFRAPSASSSLQNWQEYFCERRSPMTSPRYRGPVSPALPSQNSRAPCLFPSSALPS